MIPTISRVFGADTPPLDPTSEHAHQQLQNELSKPEYQQAQPTLLDYIRDWLQNLLQSLFPQHAGAPGVPAINFVPIAIILVVVVVVVIAFIVFGLPRLNRRSKVAGALFGEDDDRPSQAMRRAAVAAAASGDWATAIAEQFRAIARALSERTIVMTFPGTTAHGFASQAGAAFPDFSQRLAAAADSFDGVRYLGGAGTEAEYRAVSALDDDLRHARALSMAELEEATS